MKKLTFILMACLFLGTITAFAKNICTVIFSVPQMTCENCEAKVKKNIKNIKGLKAFKTDLAKKTVSITFDSDKTSVKKLQDAFKKFNYEANVLKSTDAAGDGDTNCTNACNKATSSCCKATDTCDKATKAGDKATKVCDKAIKAGDKATNTSKK